MLYLLIVTFSELADGELKFLNNIIKYFLAYPHTWNGIRNILIPIQASITRFSVCYTCFKCLVITQELICYAFIIGCNSVKLNGDALDVNTLYPRISKIYTVLENEYFFSLFESIDIATRPLFLCFSDLPCVKISLCFSYISLLKVFMLCSNDKHIITVRFESGINITSKGWSLIYLSIIEF